SRRIDAIMDDLFEHHNQFLPHASLLPSTDAGENDRIKQHLFQLLRELKVSIDNAFLLECAEFLMEEIEKEKPRIHLLQSLAHSFQKEATNTPHEEQVNKIIAELNTVL